MNEMTAKEAGATKFSQVNITKKHLPNM